MIIRNLIVEVTRRCNMSCSHCLRGEAQNLDIPNEVIETGLTKFSEISSITITGGEPSLAPEKIEFICDVIEKHGIYLGGFYIATNGKHSSPEFLKAVMRLYSICQDREEGYTCSLDISNSVYHESTYRERQSSLLRAFKFTGDKYSENNNSPILVSQGRAKTKNLSMVGRHCVPCQIQIEEGTIEDPMLYLTAQGDFVSDCDLSFETMDNPNSGFYVGTIHEDLEEQINRYNNKIEE